MELKALVFGSSLVGALVVKSRAALAYRLENGSMVYIREEK